MLNKGINDSIVKTYDGQEVLVDNSDIYHSMQECKAAKAEVNLKKKFRKRHANKKGYMTCAKCGCKGKHLTVDHIVPVSSFGGYKAVRRDLELWLEVWDESNLQILCKDCNQVKDTMSQEEFDEYDMKKIYKRGMILSNKKNSLMAKDKMQAHKVGYGVSTSCYSIDSELDTNILMKLAKMDSRILYPELIL